MTCHQPLFEPVATVTAQGGKREGSVSDVLQPWIETVLWLLSAMEISTDGVVHCCLSCYPTRFPIWNADTRTEREISLPCQTVCCTYITQVVVTQYITRAAKLNLAVNYS